MTVKTKVAAPFKTADLRDLERVVAAIERIEKRHGESYDDYAFDPINLVRSAAQEAIRKMEVCV